MDIARLVIDLVKAALWPLVIVIICVVLRDPIRGLLNRVTEFSGFGIQTKLSQAMADQATKANSTLPQNVEAEDTGDEVLRELERRLHLPERSKSSEFFKVAAWLSVARNNLERLVEQDPPAAISATWAWLTDEIARIGASRGLTGASARNVLKKLKQPQLVDLLDGQQRIYQEAKDNRKDVTRDLAETYLEVSRQIVNALRHSLPPAAPEGGGTASAEVTS